MAFNYEFPYTDPNLYNDDWLLKKMKEVLSQLDELEDWKNVWQEEYDEFVKLVEDIEAGRFPDSIRDAFSKWMSENALTLVGELVKMVFFGITTDGYFVAYIPESWEDILFNTTGYDITVPDTPDFGHLVLSFNI